MHDYLTLVLVVSLIIESIFFIWYSRTKYQGELVIEEKEDKTVYHFNLNGDPEDFANMGSVTFRIKDSREKHSQ